MTNRLAGESSPYLLQHKDNPVDWYPWGEEAFELARTLDRPVFVSIGYAACHWCHVMAHESFENPEIAALMNELFVNVKVDREERPDVDAVYMNTIHVMGEGGGWPLSAFCDPEGRPFYVGTYYPPTDRHGRPGFPRLLQMLAAAYRERREQVTQNTTAVLDGLRQLDEHHRRGAVGRSPGELRAELLTGAARGLVQQADPVHGGLGSRPKFPSSSAHELLARAGRLPPGEPCRAAFLLQCERMAAGGIYDHLGGGFARYSVDERWLVPHFEKMLYDNAQLLAIYADALAMTGAPAHAEVIAGTIDWLEREMRHHSGGFYASQDADSEGEEGKYYVWTPVELRAVLGPADAILFADAYGVTEAGNFEHGRSVLSRVKPRGSASDEAALAGMRQRLLAARQGRVPPATDDKILAGWNGLLLSGLVRAWEVTGQDRALSLARGVADFLSGVMLSQDGERLARVYAAGQVKLDGTIDDYAFVARGFLDLAQATGEEASWRRGAALTRVLVERFYEERDQVGIFFMTPRDGGALLVHRPESHQDGAIPSGAAVAVECLLLLGLVADDRDSFALAERYLAGRAPQGAQQPFAASRLLAALDLYLHGSTVWVTGGRGAEELRRAARRGYAPTTVLAGPWAAAHIAAGKVDTADGRAQAYLCRGQSCQAPVSEPEALQRLVGAGS